MRTSLRRLVISAAIYSILVVRPALAAPVTPFFQGLGMLPGNNSQYGPGSSAYAVSGDGKVVVGSSSSASGNQAFRWTAATGMVGLGDLPGGKSDSFAAGVSYDGSVIVGASSSALSEQNAPGVGYSEPFRWTASGGMVGLGYLSTGVWAYGGAYDVSANGTVIVGNSTDQEGYERPFRWTQSGMQNLGHLDSYFASNQNSANAVSADGTKVVGMSTTQKGREGFLWTAATGMQNLGALPNPRPGDAFTYPTDISPDGSTVVGEGYAGPNIEAFRWTAATGIVGLGDLPGGYFISSANGVSANGYRIVGSGFSASGSTLAVVWDGNSGPQELRSLLVQAGLGATLAGWELTSASDISDDGQTIVGYGYGPTGYQAWIARLPLATTVPEPSALPLAACGAALVAACIWRTRRTSRRPL